MTILWSYYEYNMNICFSSKFAPGIPSVLALIRPVFWSALPLLFPRDLIFFCCVKPKTYLNREINCSEINCNKLVGIQSTTLIIGLSICKSWDSVETCINKYFSKAETLLRKTDQVVLSHWKWCRIRTFKPYSTPLWTNCFSSMLTLSFGEVSQTCRRMH